LIFFNSIKQKQFDDDVKSHQKTQAMAISVITQEDLKQFKIELLSEIRDIFPHFQLEKRFVRTREARKILDGISVGKLQLMRDKGEVPFTKIGGTIFYDKVQLEKILSNKSLSK